MRDDFTVFQGIVIGLVIAAVLVMLLSSCAPLPPTTPTATSRVSANSDETITPRPTNTSRPTNTPRPTSTDKPTLIRPHSCIPNKEPVEARVTRIIDGDTIEVSVVGGIERVRLIGIDTPESGQDGFRSASDYTSLLVNGKTVLLWQDVSDRDRYSRLLAYVTVGDKFVNYLLVKNGYARSYRYAPDTSCSNLFDSVEVRPTSTSAPLIIIPPIQSASNCHPSYEGACLKIGAGDYDCAGGGGNGPNYTGKVRIVGWDEFKLDRDSDGWGCE